MNAIFAPARRIVRSMTAWRIVGIIPSSSSACTCPQQLRLARSESPPAKDLKRLLANFLALDVETETGGTGHDAPLLQLMPSGKARERIPLERSVRRRSYTDRVDIESAEHAVDGPEFEKGAVRESSIYANARPCLSKRDRRVRVQAEVEARRALLGIPCERQVEFPGDVSLDPNLRPE